MAMNNFGPAYQHTHSAVRYLVKGDGDIRNRLKDAWGWAQILKRADVVVPETISDEVEEMHAFWEPFSEPKIHSAADSLSLEQCEEEAMRIVTWLCRIAEARHEAHLTERSDS